MKNKDHQQKDNESLIKTLRQIGRMYSNTRPGFADRIKRQIPENLKTSWHGSLSIKTVMNIRIGSPIAAAIIVGEIILLLSLFGGADLVNQVQMQGKFLAKHYLAPAADTWNTLTAYLQQYGRSPESGRQIDRRQTVARKTTVPEQQKPEPRPGGVKCKKAEDIGAEELVAVVRREAGPDRPLEKKKCAEQLGLKALNIQDYTTEKTQTDEQMVIDALRSFGRITGTYPSNLEMLTVMQEFRDAYRAKEAAKEIPKDYKDQQLPDTTRKLRQLCEFYNRLLKWDKKPAYYGARLNLDKADAVLMRWRLITGEYRVIFGNLQTGTVTAGQLKQLEAELPK
jgi:hypothetical protein